LQNAIAPIHGKTIAEKFYARVQGTPWGKLRAYKGMMRWPKYYGHTQQEIWELIRKETAGRYHVDAYNGRTHARGLMQVREIALRDIPNGYKFYRWKNITKTKRIKFLNRKRIYDPYYNLQAGCCYYRICKRRARAQKIGRFKFSRMQVAGIYYVAGVGTWRNSLRPTLEYINGL
jgi:hypothetical protein